MSTFNERIVINAPIDQGWGVLARIGDIDEWSPGVKSSRLLSEEAEGVGAARHCDLDGRNYVQEQVIVWESPHRLTIRIVDTNMPLAKADFDFGLQPADASTEVTVSPAYRLKYGLVGSLLDLLFVRRSYRGGMRGLLRGLKEHVEGAAPSAEAA